MAAPIPAEYDSERTPSPGQIVKLHQIKIEFDAAQDRLLMRVSTQTTFSAPSHVVGMPG